MVLNTKIAYHIKLPYVRDTVDIFNVKTNVQENTDSRYYNGTYNTMYYIKSFDNITYFRPTNNLLTYERKTDGEIAVFVPDFPEASYKLVRFSKINVINKSKKNLLVETAKGKLYFISLDIQWHDNKRYIAGIDVKSGKPLFMIDKEDESLSDLLYVVNRNVIPILQVKKQDIFIYLLDLSNDKVGVISWNVMNIRQLIVNSLKLGGISGRIKREIMQDEIKYFNVIEGMYFSFAEYDIRSADVTGSSKDLYTKSIEVRLDLSAYGRKYYYILNNVSIKIEVDNDNIICYFDTNILKTTVRKKVHDSQQETYEHYISTHALEYSDNNRMLKRSYKFKNPKDYKYISTDLYENECYLIQQNKEGIMINEKKPGKYENHYRSSLYRYGKYLIIIQDHSYGKMVFIDTARRLIYKFVIYSNQHSCAKSRFTYHYYPSYKANKLFFLSKDLQCLLMVDMNKVEHFISTYDTKNCDALYGEDMKEKYASIEKISTVLDVKEMITKAIYNKHKFEVKSDDIRILGHQVDKENETLYITVKYITRNVENIGVFVLDLLSSTLQINLLYSATTSPQNPMIKLFKGKDNNFRFISNLDLYKLSFNKLNIGNIDIYYNDDGVFVSIKYNRTSCKVIYGDYERDKMVIENINNLIIMKYNCFYTSDVKIKGIEFAEIGCHSSYGLLIYDLALVQKMPAVLM